jgi:hypothetical protein
VDEALVDEALVDEALVDRALVDGAPMDRTQVNRALGRPSSTAQYGGSSRAMGKISGTGSEMTTR